MNDLTTSASASIFYEAGTKVPLVYIVVLNYNGPDLTLDCINSVLKIDYPNFGVLVVDNASTDDSVARFNDAFSDPRLELLVNRRNEGYAGGNNRGIERALLLGADYIFILNNDTVAEPGCLRPLVNAMEFDCKIGISAGPIRSTTHGTSPTCGHYINLYTARSGTKISNGITGAIEVDYLLGAALMIRSRLIAQIGGFDESFFLMYEEMDLCFRARKSGLKVCFVPSPGITHLGQATIGRSRANFLYFYVRNRAWFIRRHGTLLHHFSFGIFSVCTLYPRLLVGRVIRRDLASLKAVMRGIWEGHSASILPSNRVGKLAVGPAPLACSERRSS
jgi:GT2 family glycosyltransferase